MFVVRTRNRQNQTIPVEIDEDREYQVITAPNDGSPSKTYLGTGRKGVLEALAQMLHDRFVNNAYAMLDIEFYEREILPMRENDLEEARNEYNAVSSHLGRLYGEMTFMDEEVAADHRMLFNRAVEQTRKMWDSLRVYNGSRVLHDAMEKFDEGALDVDARIELDIDEELLTALIADGATPTYGAFIEDFAFDMATTTDRTGCDYLLPFSISSVKSGFFRRGR